MKNARGNCQLVWPQDPEVTTRRSMFMLATTTWLWISSMPPMAEHNEVAGTFADWMSTTCCSDKTTHEALVQVLIRGSGSCVSVYLQTLEGHLVRA